MPLNTGSCRHGFLWTNSSQTGDDGGRRGTCTALFSIVSWVSNLTCISRMSLRVLGSFLSWASANFSLQVKEWGLLLEKLNCAGGIVQLGEWLKFIWLQTPVHFTPSPGFPSALWVCAGVEVLSSLSPSNPLPNGMNFLSMMSVTMNAGTAWKEQNYSKTKHARKHTNNPNTNKGSLSARDDGSLHPTSKDELIKSTLHLHHVMYSFAKGIGTLGGCYS